MNSVLELFIKGGPVMWPLLLCSLISLTVSMERAIFWLREKRSRKQAAVDDLFRLAEQGKIQEALNLSSGKSNALVNMLSYGLLYRASGLRESMELKAAELVSGMKRGMRIMETIITVSPLLGFLGTVLGIINSFFFFSQKGIVDPQRVVNGIAEALITTAFGLMIAIMTLVGYNIFVGLLQKEAHLLEQTGSRFEAVYKKGAAHEGTHGV
jgi:biopolymer transport protein ExbB